VGLRKPLALFALMAASSLVTSRAISVPSANKLSTAVLVDGIKYPLTAAGINAAMADACDGGTPGAVTLPAGTITLESQISWTSDCSVRGAGLDATVLQASFSIDPVGLTFARSAENVHLSDLAIDGNRSTNKNVFDCLDIIDSRMIYLEKLRISNCRLNGMNIGSGSSFVDIAQTSVYNNGEPLPANNIGVGIGIFPGNGCVSQVSIKQSDIYDNNYGIGVSNSRSSCPVDGIAIVSNVIHSNGNDGILGTANSSRGGQIRGLRIENNETYCNGWPANGRDFSSHCTPGFFQRGSSSSAGGVGVDLIQNGDRLLVQPIVLGNDTHDNVFDGIATTSQIFSTVNTNGSAVTWIAGAKFSLGWKTGMVVLIHGVPYPIGSVSSDTALVLLGSPKTQFGVGLAGPSFMGAIISANQIYLNGNRSLNVGAGSYNQFSDGNVFTGNIAFSNNFEGFENYYGNDLSYVGGGAYSNDTSKTPGRENGYDSFGGMGNRYIAVGADDNVRPATQLVGIAVKDLALNTYIGSSELYGSKGSITDAGKNTVCNDAAQARGQKAACR
jgi:hypothetical protein